MRLGIDYLGGANYGRVIRDNHPRGFGAGFILNTNKPHWPKTNAWPVISALVASHECPFIRVHAIWEDSHNYDPKKHDKIILQEAERMAGFANMHPNIRFYFSPFCERSNESRAFDSILATIQRAFTKLEVVNCVYRAKFKNGGIINEVHGTKAGPKGEARHAYSYDGTQCVDRNIVADIRARNGAEYFMFWTSQMNGKWNAKQAHEKGADKTKRPARQAWAYPDLVKSLGAYADWQNVHDTIGPRRIWKTHADQHAAKRSPREGKPVFITPDAGAIVTLVDARGNELARMKREPEDFSDGSKRKMYRLGMFGYQLAQIAREKSGSPHVKLVGANGDLGVIHPAFRAGSFR